jgi:hypothetical protein
VLTTSAKPAASRSSAAVLSSLETLATSEAERLFVQSAIRLMNNEERSALRATCERMVEQQRERLTRP